MRDCRYFLEQLDIFWWNIVEVGPQSVICYCTRFSKGAAKGDICSQYIGNIVFGTMRSCGFRVNDSSALGGMLQLTVTKRIAQSSHQNFRVMNILVMNRNATIVNVKAAMMIEARALRSPCHG